MGRRKRITRIRTGDRGPRIVKSECECDPLFERLCDRIREDRRQIVSHILETNTRLSHRLDSLEQRTRHEVSGDQYHQHDRSHDPVKARTFAQTLMETQAEERSVLQDRLEWRLARERLQASVREDAWEEAFREEMSGQLEVNTNMNRQSSLLLLLSGNYRRPGEQQSSG